MMNVQDVMTAEVITVSPDTSVHDAAVLMAEHGVSGLPVVDRERRMVGVVTEGDLIVRQAAPREQSWWQRFFDDSEARARDYQKATGITVGEVMTRTVISVSPTAGIDAAARILDDRRLRRLPVVRDGELVGIVSRADLVKALAAAPVTSARPSDGELAQAMRDRMAAEPWTTSFGIIVEAAGGVISLWGFAATEMQRSALETMARAIPGCRGVDNHLLAGLGTAYTYGV